ncbi:hypothetical protein [Microbacterium soli]|uniref:Uncharacterized protein n=1 Tax=Microbacterium soli TaxID=446075 RepID=A0ABP7NLM0_9MICO
MSKQIAVKDRVHAPSAYPNRGYCGTTDLLNVTEDWRFVTCPNCAAARRADEEAR